MAVKIKCWTEDCVNYKFGYCGLEEIEVEYAECKSYEEKEKDTQ